jgi:glycerophosphoryl diester phosphodiesterase
VHTGFPFLDDGPPVLAFAHRGGAEHPALVRRENTRAAFAHAVSLGYRYLETDVHLTRDGVLVAFHDALLERVAGVAGSVEDLDSAELVRTHGLHDRVLVGSFSGRRLRRFRRLAGRRVPTAASPGEVAAYVALSGRIARRLTRNGPAALQVPHRCGPLTVASTRLVRRAHAAGMPVHVWTIDDEAEMRLLLDRGVDGLMTDRTDILRDVLRGRGLWQDRTDGVREEA